MIETFLRDCGSAMTMARSTLFATGAYRKLDQHRDDPGAVGLRKGAFPDFVANLLRKWLKTRFSMGSAYGSRTQFQSFAMLRNFATNMR